MENVLELKFKKKVVSNLNTGGVEEKMVGTSYPCTGTSIQEEICFENR